MKQCMPLLRSLVALLALSVSVASVAADFCWKDTQTRGVGTIPTVCTGGKENDSGLCYDKCPGGMTGVGPVCWSSCPAGYRDMGAICHIDKLLLKEGSWECTARGLLNECWWGRMTCDSDYTNIGLLCALTATSTPAGFSGTYLDPMKNTYGRGAGTIPTGCAAGEEYDAGLCYKTCPGGMSGVGPVCWGRTPAGWVGCGMGAASSDGKCGEVVFDQVFSVGEVALNIATAGASNAVTKPARLAKFAKLKEAYQAAKAANPNFAQAARRMSTANTAQGNVRTGLDILDTASNGEDLTDEEIVALAATVASLADPSGVSGVVAAYTHPVCSKLGLPLSEPPASRPRPIEPPSIPVTLCTCLDNDCTRWVEGDIPGSTCKYTVQMAAGYHGSGPQGTCGTQGKPTKGNPLCGGTEQAKNNCFRASCKTGPITIAQRTERMKEYAKAFDAEKMRLYQVPIQAEQRREFRARANASEKQGLVDLLKKTEAKLEVQRNQKITGSDVTQELLKEVRIVIIEDEIARIRRKQEEQGLRAQASEADELLVQSGLKDEASKNARALQSMLDSVKHEY